MTGSGAPSDAPKGGNWRLIMLRDKNLIPLSHQHQHALALCVRIERAQPIPPSDLDAWQAEIEQRFEEEIKFHFAAEESVLFPGARRFHDLVPLIDELIREHDSMRQLFFQATDRRMSPENLSVLAQQLSAHIRKEERQLFERLQQLMSPRELDAVGGQLESALKDAAQSCILTNEATRLRRK